MEQAVGGRIPLADSSRAGAEAAEGLSGGLGAPVAAGDGSKGGSKCRGRGRGERVGSL